MCLRVLEVGIGILPVHLSSLDQRLRDAFDRLSVDRARWLSDGRGRTVGGSSGDRVRLGLTQGREHRITGHNALDTNEGKDVRGAL